MTNIYHLRPDNLSDDIEECLNTLAAQARRKVVSGIAFVVYVEGYGYIVNSAGTANQDPTRTRGMLQALDDKLALRIDGGRP